MDVTQVEIAMITRRILVRFNNDGMACFDRIMPHILSLCLRSYQTPAEFTGLLGDLLWYAKYAIKTVNGVSKETYSHSTESSVFGSGQGSTVSATGWGKLVSIALDLHDKQRFGSQYRDPEGVFTTIVGMLGFVDDNNISNTGKKHESIKDVIKRTQHDAQLWNNILKATGGTFNLLKCFFQVITTTFSRGGAPVIAAHDESWYIDIVDKTDNSTQRVEAISAYTLYKSLGTIQGICQKQDDQFEVQLAKATRLSRALACSNVSEKCAFIHWNTCFIASVVFPLCNKINCTDQIEKKQRSLKVQLPLPPTVKETTEILKVAQKQVRKLWKDFQSKQTTVIEDQEEVYIASRPNMCPLRAARIFKNFKDSSGIYSELPTKRHKGGGLNTIEVPLPLEGETLKYHTITDPPLIEQEILRRNKRHFRQAENTPLAGKDVSDKIGFGTTTQTANEILEKTASLDEITDDPTSKRLLKEFKTSKPELEIEVTKEKIMD